MTCEKTTGLGNIIPYQAKRILALTVEVKKWTLLILQEPERLYFAVGGQVEPVQKVGR